ncbi:DUF2017 domain-containing protein [Corynebacterium silvaticum]|uniref:DUF2017 domain-containing protein n=1 Tax=Corynebacterium silvaticum TaxID=2320431 RepID=A0A7Y4PAC1_9CORY|nr:DUF2017 domain-containing protein [Corynebacterium silvaticum]ARU46650.1 DUF2017 domain-containing protein [Corynebacterium silvaticum]MBH5299814.1 DUF2017 domain-containing protein [Corynebacterium silvaticum]NOM63868.1 DUF2017 domain-containing protein [Corynebacterium silvaticum]NON71135.1 DUF2017 domain-containing protein [Corynebacterium silvaticum]TFA91977.1 DUF2017 domain-containing protein [Corynebacterium silvaticum]
MQPWKKKKGLMRGVHFVCAFEPMEREVLGNLASTVSEALIHRAQSAPKDELAELTGMPSGHKEAPTDPALARLLPDFEKEGDEEFEGDNSLLRCLHETDITRAKIEHLQVLGQALGPDGGVHVDITEPEAHAWIAALNDIRLYVASGEVFGAEAEEDRDSLVEWLAYNQESLLTAMMG